MLHAFHKEEDYESNVYIMIGKKELADTRAISYIFACQ